MLNACKAEREHCNFTNHYSRISCVEAGCKNTVHACICRDCLKGADSVETLTENTDLLFDQGNMFESN